MEGQFDPRVDAYIEKAAPFAQPVLVHLRKLMHQACPRVTESIKWSMEPRTVSTDSGGISARKREGREARICCSLPKTRR